MFAYLIPIGKCTEYFKYSPLTKIIFNLGQHYSTGVTNGVKKSVMEQPEVLMFVL